MRLVVSQLSRIAFGLIASGGLALCASGTAMAAGLPEATTISGASVTTNVVSDGLASTPKAAIITSHDSESTFTTRVEAVVIDKGTKVAKVLADTTSATPSDTPVLASDTATLITTSASSAPVQQVLSQQTESQARVLANEGKRPIYSNSILARVFTNSTTLVSASGTGLALATAPATTTTKSPQVPQSSGLLTALATELAGILTPPLFAQFYGHTAVRTFTYIIVIILLTGLINAIASTYGQLLRRSGFATAARSDVASLTLATPLFLDYSPTWVPIVLFSRVRYQNPHIYNVPNALKKGGE
jgi:hypothetical protein